MPMQNADTAHVRWDRDVACLTIEVYVDRSDLEAMTGLTTREDLAQWLEEQRSSLDEMMVDGDAKFAIVGYLSNYADSDREEGRLPSR